MAGTPVDRAPWHTIVLPVLGIAAWLVIGKVGLQPVALVLVVVLLGNVIAAVHHAEIVALRVGEPFGTLVLALAVTVIEVGLIVSIMLGGEPQPTLMRDSVHAVVMLVLHGLAGLCIVVGAFRQREHQGAEGFAHPQRHDLGMVDGGDHVAEQHRHQHQRDRLQAHLADQQPGGDAEHRQDDRVQRGSIHGCACHAPSRLLVAAAARRR